MSELEAILSRIVSDPDPGLWLILADWLDEHDDPRRAELLRLNRLLVETCLEPEKHPERAAQQTRMVALLTEGVQPVVPRYTVNLGSGIQMPFAWIPPGTFLMGSPPDEPQRTDYEETRHRVTLTRGFWLGIHPVTQAQWQAVTGRTPSHFQGQSLPVETISWDDCQEFCKQLGEKVGKTFRLPTVAEWEYACRAGTTTPFHFGETLSTDQANYDGNTIYGSGKKGVYRETTTPVGIFPANAWGLHDMHGNVYEWCNDVFVDPSTSDDGSDSLEDEIGPVHLLRGGSWYDFPWNCRSAFCDSPEPGIRFRDQGCRVLLSQD